MRIQNLLRLAAVIMPLALSPVVASGQGANPRLSTANIANKGLITSVKGDKSRQIASIAAKRLNVDPLIVNINPAVIKSVSPDLFINNVFQVSTSADNKTQHYVIVGNKGPVAAGPCVLKFMYGDTLDTLESVDYDIPAIAAGASVNIAFTAPAKNYHWWLFGADAGNKLKEANFSNNIYLIEFKEGPKQPEIK